MRRSRLLSSLSAVFIFLIFLSIVVFSKSGLLHNKFITLRNIKIIGTKNIANDSIVNIIGYDNGESLFNIDIQKIKNTLEKKFSWIREVVVIRRFPSGLEIYVKERAPVAIWRDKNNNKFIIDELGNIIIPYISGEKFKDLVVLSGQNADKYVSDIVLLININHKFAQNIASAVRTGDRRWDVHLKNGIVVLLPEDNYLDAWIKAVDIIVSNDTMVVKKIDMRVSDKVYFSN